MKYILVIILLCPNLLCQSQNSLGSSNELLEEEYLGAIKEDNDRSESRSARLQAIEDSTKAVIEANKAYEENVRYLKKNNPQELDGFIIPDNLLKDGMKYFALGEQILQSVFYKTGSQADYKSALEYFNKALYYGYENATIYAEKGMCEYFLAPFQYTLSDLNYENAIEYFTKALKLNQPGGWEQDILIVNEHYEITDSGYLYHADNTIGYYWICPSLITARRGICKLHLQDNRGAITDFNRALKYKGTDYLYGYRGSARFNLGDFTGSKLDLNKAINFDNEDKVSYYNRGLCNWAMKLKEAACNDWSRSGELGFSKAYDKIKENCR